MCTSANFAVRVKLPNCVPFRTGEFGFTRDCVAQCENMLALLLENVGMDAAVRLGDPALWKQSIDDRLKAREGEG